MLEEKVEADRVDDALRNPRQNLAEFVADELWRRYGLRQLAYRHLVNFAQSAISMAAHSERVRTFAAAMGWLAGEEEWPASKLHFYCALLPLLFEPTAIRGKLAPTGPVWLPMAQLVQAVRKMFYSRSLEESLLAELELLSEAEPPAGHHGSGRRVSFDDALGLLLRRFEPQWDTLVSQLHRPAYSYDQLSLSREAGHVTQQARQAAGSHLLSSAHASDKGSAHEGVGAEQQAGIAQAASATALDGSAIGHRSKRPSADLLRPNSATTSMRVRPRSAASSMRMPRRPSSSVFSVTNAL